MTNTTASPSAIATLPLGPGTYDLDANHAGVYFQVRHLGISNVRGMFKTFDATLTVGATLDDVDVTATIDLASIETGQPDRDAHLLTTDFFDAEQHPQMHFTSTAVRSAGDDTYELDGNLTINGVTKPVTLDVEFNGTSVMPQGEPVPHTGFYATTEIRRSEFGIDFNMPLGMGKVALGEKVKVELDLQFVPR
jgi:polyisoprenoid-binding protein YceI